MSQKDELPSCFGEIGPDCCLCEWGPECEFETEETEREERELDEGDSDIDIGMEEVGERRGM